MPFQHHRLAALAVLLVGTPAASAPQPPHYLLSAHFKDGDRLIGNPKLEVSAGESATITVGDAARGSFTMRMMATAVSEGKLSVASVIDAVTPAGVHRRAAPTLIVDVGRPATIEFGELSASTSPVRVSFTYQKL